MERYVSESLASGFIRPLSFPVNAAFFFIKKDDTLQQGIDYWVLPGSMGLRLKSRVCTIRSDCNIRRTVEYLYL